MAEIVVRVHSRSGRSRFSFKQNSTLGELKQQVHQRLKVPPELQVMRLQGGSQIIGNNGSLLRSLNIVNGTIIQLDAEAEVPNTEVFVKKVSEPDPPLLSPQRSQGREVQNPQFQYIRKCNHGPRQKCINCFAKQDAKAHQEGLDIQPRPQDRTWMCNHPPDSKCMNCLKDDFVAGIKHQSFEYFMAAKKKKCQHSDTTKCANCLAPADVSYKVKLDCNKHPPWPLSVCNSCMPATAVLARQPYRHVDYVQLMNVPQVTGFVRYWQQSHHMQQRVGIMYGYYAEDPNYPDGVRAVVETIYQPPQIGETNGFQILNDPDQELADLIAGALQLEKIGWIFTSINHDAYLSSHEIRMAAKFQQEHITVHPSGYKVSKFVTVVLKPTDDGNSMPEAYMVSDQCQALQRDNVFGQSESRRRLVKRSPVGNELLPTIMAENSVSEEFQPEWFIVSLGCGIPKKSMTILHHQDFPIENRDQPVTFQEIKSYLQKHRNQPDFRRCSNFHFLLQLAKIFDPESGLIAAQCVAEERDLPEGLKALLNHL